MHFWCLIAEWLFWINCALMHALKEMTKFWMNKQSVPRRDSLGHSYSEFPVFVIMEERKTWKFHRTLESQVRTEPSGHQVTSSQILPHPMYKFSLHINNLHEMVTGDCINNSDHMDLTYHLLTYSFSLIILKLFICA